MREPVIERFPKAPRLPRNIDAYIKRIDARTSRTPTIHCRSKRYRETCDRLERVRTGTRGERE